MESCERSSFEDLSSTSSALRRSNRTPTAHRLSLGLSLRHSGSATSISESISSFGTEKHSSCVTRETSNEECALHRFIVWAAVKRNASTRMTLEYRTECPMLRCRKRFSNHELMLQHLYSCDHLNSGEYWCFDCGKAENFQDTKCRQHLGHPSRRRRLMSIAKSVFSSLGRSNKATGGYYSSLETAQHTELHSNEIHEIDSSEVVLPPIYEHEEAYGDGYLSRSSASANYNNYTGSYSINQPKKSQAPVTLVDESLNSWEVSHAMPPVSPMKPQNPSTNESAIKPRLQVNTVELDNYWSTPGVRSKNLVQSDSVRSANSATSTYSNSSTSCTVSPMSAWSGAWSLSRGFDSSLTSPADNLPAPNDVFPCMHSLQPQLQVEEDSFKFSQFMDAPADLNEVIELPSEVTDHLGMTSFEKEKESPCSSIETSVRYDFSSLSEASQQAVEIFGRNLRQSEACEIIVYVQTTLKLHINNSMAKLDLLIRDGKSALVTQFHKMSPNLVATEGLTGMSEILRGEKVTSPLKLLCFTHVAYSLSLVAQGQADITYWTSLFAQAVSYSSWLRQEEKAAYIQVVEFLWKPADMADEAFKRLMRKTRTSFSSLNPNLKEKDTVRTLDFGNDPLLLVSQRFLDELELAALQDITRPDVQASNLCYRHLNDINLATSPNSPFICAAKSLITLLSWELQDEVPFVRAMESLMRRIASNHVCTFRLLELELMQCGKLHLSVDVDFDKYIQQIRLYIDSSRADTSLPSYSRLQYQALAIEMMLSVIQRPQISSPLIIDEPLAAAENLMNHDKHKTDLGERFGVDNRHDSSVVSLHGKFSLPLGVPEKEHLLGKQGDPPSTADSLQMSPPSSISFDSVSPCQSSENAFYMVADKSESDICCEICGYRPKGKPRWFHGSMTKHMKNQHAKMPPKWWPCPFPGCNSRYKNRPDNLRQHQIEKGHFIDGQENPPKSRKRKQMA